MRIRRLVEQVDEQHREAMRSVSDDLAEVHFGARSAAVDESRRRFVRRLGLGGAVAIGGVALPTAVLAPSVAAQDATTDAAAEPTLPLGDLTVVEFAEGLELAAVAAYRAAVDTRMLSSLEANVCERFGQHHADHAAALGGLLVEAGARTDEVTPTANAAIVGALGPQLADAPDAAALLGVLYSVEEGAAATYLEALGVLESVTVAGPAASIMPVEAQHAVVLGQLTDLPSADFLPVVQPTAGAFDPADYAG